MKRKTFKQICAEVPQPKDLQPDDRLPYEFDLHWDLKYGYQILESSYHRQHSFVNYLLAEHGFKRLNETLAE